MASMCCPSCKLILSEIKQNDTNINICHCCRGIWLGMEAHEKLLGPEWRENNGIAATEFLFEADINRRQKAPEQLGKPTKSQNPGKASRDHFQSAFDSLRTLR